MVAFAALAGGCAAPQPEPESIAAREAEAAHAAAAATAAEQEAERRDEARRDDAERAETRARREEDRARGTLVVVDPGGAPKAKTPRELSEASRRERALHGDRSVGEITDDNLADLAAQGKVTFAGGEAGEGGDAIAGVEGGAAAGDGEATEEVCGEACWRRRVRELREGWSRAATEIGDWEDEAAELRWRFYAEDDPWVRDGRIKPAWDRALDRMRRSRDEAERYRERLAETLEDGRRAGALPGWLREGISLEPKQDEAAAEAADAAEPVEPDVLEDDAVQPKQH
jgi:hypothetical protein